MSEGGKQNGQLEGHYLSSAAGGFWLLFCLLGLLTTPLANLELNRGGGGYRPRVDVVDMPEKTGKVAKVKEWQSWKGKYVNYEYGYTLIIPRGLLGLSAPSPAPQHGIKIVISNAPAAAIFVDAYLSSVDYASLDDAVDSDLNSTPKNVRELQVVQRQQDRLGILEARRVLMRYKDATTGEVMIKDMITSIRKAKRSEEGVLYTVTLVTPKPRYKSDRIFFESILRSWRLRPLLR